MVNVSSLAPPDLPETIYAYTDPILVPTIANAMWGTTQAIQLKRTQGVLRYTLLCDALTISGGTTPTAVVSNLLPVFTHVQVQADDDTLFDVDMVMWLEYLRLVQGLQAAQTGYEFDIDMADMDYRYRGQLLPATLLRAFQYNQVQMNVTFNTVAVLTSGGPTACTTNVHLTETDVNRDLIDQLPVFVVKKLQSKVPIAVASALNDFTTILPQTGLLKAMLLYAQNSSGTGLDTIVGTVKIILNDSFNETVTTWNMLKKLDRGLFSTAPNAGFALKAWDQSGETGKFLNISDVRKVTSVDLQVQELLGAATETLTVLRVFYK